MEGKGRRRFNAASVAVWAGPIVLLVVVAAFIFAGRSTQEQGTGTRVLVIGLDGLEWDILNPLFDQGKLPNLERMVREGTSGILMSRSITNSPVIWTTIATGKKRERHGITGFFSDEGTGGHTPWVSADRKVAALWNMMGMEDRTVCSLGWWVSWPAEEVNGVVVSAFAPYDPVAYHKRGVHAENPPEGLTYPESLVEEIAPYMVRADSVTHEDLARFVDVDNWNHVMFQFERVGQGVDYVLPWTYATDLSYVQIAEYLLNKRRYDLSMIYIQGTDTVGHRFWSFREESNVLHDTLVRYNLMLEEEATYRRYFGHTIDNYYIFTDELVGRLLALIDENTVVIVCSDHGFGPFLEPEAERWVGHTFAGNHRDDGTIIMWGPGIRKGKHLSDENPPYIWDVTPTILAIMGLPLAVDMDGSPITDAFDARFMQNFRPRFVATYDVNYKAGERPASVPMSAEYEERLRSLGYIQ